MEPYKESVNTEHISMVIVAPDNQEMEQSLGYDYEVFLSFRGPDTRTDITDYLYTSMIEAGIRAYKDDEELRVGGDIGDQLLYAIEQSKISIPIFSKGYADSTWCLRELVKMVESKNTRRHKIMPIFYDVTPSVVKYQTEHYGNAMVSHANKKRFDDETINKWKAALNEVGALKGWDLQSMRNRGKGEFVKEVVNNVLTELKAAYLEVSDCLVEVDNHVDEIMRVIGTHNDETNIVGIHGIGGVGKTTLAKIVYNKLCCHFVNCCFLSNIRETEITHLQNQLICNILRKKWPDVNNIMEGKKVIKERLCSKTVLLLLDDVDEAIQLDALVQKREWFGKGSKIIITTRDRGILNVPTLVDETYELIGMDFDHSLQLFCKHAFRRDYPVGRCIFQSERAVNICGGLPLALEVIGSLLSGKREEEWDSILKELEKFPQGDVQRKLMISIDALNEDQKKIFLDVACFFIGFDKRIVIHMWESCEFLPHQSLGILQQRSLIKIREDNQLWMHDWLRDIGRDFIRQGSGKKPEKQQWVWTHEQAAEVLEKTQIGGDVRGIDSIEAICLKLDKFSQYSLIKECLARLFNLRFLQVDSKDFKGNYRCSNFVQTTFGPRILPELRWLSWNYFPMVFKLTNFSMRKLVILDLSMSKITEKWNGWSHIKLAKNLKVLNLTECQKLHKTPKFSFHENLERLILEGCENLVQIDPSISHLKKLVFLNLKYCHSLRKLPDEMGALESLRELLLDDTSIEEIPEWRSMKKLEILSLDTCTSLNRFSLVGCTASAAKLSLVDSRLTQFPKSIENFNSLIELDLSWSTIEELPDSIGNMKNLKVLKMGNSSVKKLPSAIGMLEKLEELEVGGPNFGGEIPGNIGKLRFLRTLVLKGTRISVLPRLPESLITLYFYTFSMETMPDLSNLLNLTTLQLQVFRMGPSKLEESPSPWWIGRLRMLKFLDLYTSRIITLSSDLTLLSQLKQLQLQCRNLQCLPRLPTNLSYLAIKFCRRIKTTNDLSNLKALSALEILDCEELTEIEGLEGLENLRTLKLSTLPLLAKLPDLTNLKKLKKIDLNDCPKLLEIQGSPESLEILDITNCLKLQKLPDRSSFKNLKVCAVGIKPASGGDLPLGVRLLEFENSKAMPAGNFEFMKFVT
ncbi:disease resistance protein RPV1-like [Rhodamnia argentea]|uniref:Disease resistance protein RPV1-like n=1 Tax=Rhodamnia argentea TaxID=178133 RepID=A0A8B8MSP9_9MYRT|nr:disease resistance protein RPV1-like [Rhodamnia argentea]